MAFQKEQPAHRSLKAILAERTSPVIAWVGAGLSAAAGLPSWKGLLEGLTEAARLKLQSMNDPANKALYANALEKSRAGEYWVAFQLLEQLLGTTTYQSEIRNCLGAGISAPVPKSYELLWRLGIAGLVNLNLDPLASRAFSKSFPGTDVERFSGFQAKNLMGVLQRNKRFIANVHGTLEDTSTWVFTNTKLKPLLADAGYRQFVSTCLTARTVLFAGVTADDIAIRDHFESLNAAGVSGIEHFWITDRNDAETDRWAEGLNIRVIRYDPTGNHTQLLECLSDLASAVPGNEESSEPVAFTGSATGGELLAPEDLVAMPLEVMRAQLNAKALEILGDQDEKAYAEYARFSETYDEAIDRAWYVTTTPPKNVLLGYTLVRRANSGAFGVVYEAIAPDGERVAVKLLRRDVRTDGNMLQTFRRGVRSMKILQRHRVGGMVGFRNASEIPALVVMEWIDGPDLDDVVKKSRHSLDWHTSIRIANDLANVIFEAHKLTERVLHRDIRPQNVMLRDYWSAGVEFEVVVTDFDLSWHMDSLEHSIVAKPLGFMAPEQLRRREGKEGAQTRSALVDSFGFGMTLFYLLTGEVPVPDQQKHGDWDDTLRLKIITKSFPRWKSLPMRVARLVRGATRDQQSQRWDFSRIVGELGVFWRIVNDDYDSMSVDFIAEEIASHAESVLQYIWDDDKNAALYEAAGSKIEISGNLPTGTVQLVMQWQQIGTENWKARFKSSSDVRARMDGILEQGGWKSVRNEGSIGFTRISATCTPDAMPDTLRKLAKSVDSLAQVMRAKL